MGAMYGHHRYVIKVLIRRLGPKTDVELHAKNSPHKFVAIQNTPGAWAEYRHGLLFDAAIRASQFPQDCHSRRILFFQLGFGVNYGMGAFLDNLAAALTSVMALLQYGQWRGPTVHSPIVYCL